MAETKIWNASNKFIPPLRFAFWLTYGALPAVFIIIIIPLFRLSRIPYSIVPYFYDYMEIGSD